MQSPISAALLIPLLLHYPVEALEVASPNGTVTYQVFQDEAGHLAYSVSAEGQPRLQSARLGVLIDGLDLGEDATLGEVTRRSVLETFPCRGNKNLGTNHCEIVELPVRSGNVNWTIEVRVFDDGAGFRYRIPGAGQRRLQGESTEWQLPSASTVWFQTDTDDYEGAYFSRPADRIPLEEEVHRAKRPTHLGPPVTIEYPDGGFGMLTEASLYRYSGLTFRPQGGGRLTAAFEDDPQGWVHEGPVVSPWRVIVLSRDLNGLFNSDVIAALCDPPDPQLFPDGPRTFWIRPGKAPCTWMVFGNDGAQWERQKWFVDLSAAMGCEYLLVDAGWRTERWGWLKDGGNLWGRAAELCRYAAERNVGILLWHGFPEGREDGPALTTVEAREELFQNCQRAGVKGVKIDFFNSESKAVIDAYEDLLRRSAKYQLLINFHGANKPAGEARTWPHEISREGIREQEYVLWDRLPLRHYGALPFTRMSAGHGDFLPGYVQSRFLRNTTAAFQMASVIVFSSPFLCWPDNPEAYLDSPFLPLVRSVPVTWDETRVLPGSQIGQTVVFARRKEAEWYVAVLNCRPESVTLGLNLESLKAAGMEMTVYRDAPSGQGCHIDSKVKVPLDGRIQVSLLAGGGWIGHLRPPRVFAGW